MTTYKKKNKIDLENSSKKRDVHVHQKDIEIYFPALSFILGMRLENVSVVYNIVLF